MNKEDDLLFLTMELSRNIMIYLDERFRKCDLAFPERRLLIEIYTHESITQVELASLLQIKPASLSTRLKRLEKMGMIIRKEDEKDHRKTRIELTSNKRNIMEETKKEFEYIAVQLNQGITKEQIASYKKITEIIERNLKEIKNV